MTKIKNQNYNILVLEGGGIKGLKSLIQLQVIETKLGGNLLEYFDLIAGTSTGAIIAAMLTSGYKTKEIIELYKNEGKNIFKKRFFYKIRNPRYDDSAINNLLDYYFKEERLSDLGCEILIPAYNGTKREFVFFKKTGETCNHLVKDAVRASMSAQIYFEPWMINGDIYLDGGNGINNPSDEALDTSKIKACGKTINLLTIGTGRLEKPLEKNQNIIKWLISSVDVNMIEAAQLVNKKMKYKFDNKEEDSILGVYLYCDSLVRRSSPEMDDASDENIQNLIDDGRMSIQKNMPEVNDFLRVIKS